MNAMHPTMAGYLRPYMPPTTVRDTPAYVPNNPRIEPASLEGLYAHQTTINGVVLDCYLEYEAGFGGNFDEPAYPETITLIHALADNVPVTRLLGEEEIETIKDSARRAMLADAQDEACDREDHIYQTRRDECFA